MADMKLNTPQTPTINLSGGTSNDMQILSPGTRNHAKLSNLDYENSGHTGFQKELIFDTTPTEGSTNPVTSGGIKTELDLKANKTETIGKSGTGTNSEIFNDYTNNEATAQYSHTEGTENTAKGKYAHAEGKGCIAGQDPTETDHLGSGAHAEGRSTKALHNYTHAEGAHTEVHSAMSHAEGNTTKVLENSANSHAEGCQTEVSGTSSHAEGHITYAGPNTIPTEHQGTSGGSGGSGSGGSEGINNSSLGVHSEGLFTYATKTGAHAEGVDTWALGYGSHSEGEKTEARGYVAHAEGADAVASGSCSHAEGQKTQATGENSHAEGQRTTANGMGSHAEGLFTIASGKYQHVEGKFNIEDTADKYAHIVGNGNGDASSINYKSNAHTLDWNGNAWFQGDVRVGGSSYDDAAILSKKSDIEALKKKSIPYTTVSDYPISVSDHIEEETVINYQVYGNSTQATRSGKNLIKYPYTDTTKTAKGITFTDNGDGTITVNGTATSDAIFTLCTTNILDKSKKYFLSGALNGNAMLEMHIADNTEESHGYFSDTGNGAAIDLSNLGDWEISKTTIFIHVLSGTTLSNVVIKPQIEEGTTATAYEQYGVMPSPDYPSEIQSVGDLVTDETSEYYGKYDVPVKMCGKNLFDAQSAVLTNAVLNDDGTITILSNGGQIDIYLKAGTYSIKINCDFSESIFLREGQVNNGYIKMLTNGTVGSFTLTSDNYLRIDSFATNGTYNSIMLVEGSYTSDTMPSYESYIPPVTKHIYLDEPLRKVGNYADYIDFENQKVVRHVGTYGFKGTETFSMPSTTLQGYSVFRYLALATIAKQPFYCNYFRFISKDYMYVDSECLAKYVTTGQMFFVVSTDRITQNDITAFKNWLKELYSNNNPLRVYYILAMPTEEPITVPELTSPNSAVMNVSSETATQPSQIDLTYYQDINKVITNLTNAVLAQGGNI